MEELIKTKNSFIRVKLFGMSKDLVGEKEITLPLTKVTVRELEVKVNGGLSLSDVPASPVRVCCQ